MHDKQPSSVDTTAGIPVVGIGASAGGLEAFKLLLSHLPPDTGFAVVLIQHLDPTHHSSLSDILGRATEMPVREAADGTPAEPNHVYVIPPNAELAIANRVLRLTPRGQVPGPHMPIDHFLRSLARDCGSGAIGVILSGTGTDGSGGLQAVKEAGGVTFVQEPATAEFPTMPQMAKAATRVDFVLSPERIATELVRIARSPYFAAPERAEQETPPREAEDQFRPIFTLMMEATGVDFSLYRKTTIHRRILRRMTLRNVAGIEEYLSQLERDPGERSALQRDLLISVTGFFRDPDSFEMLKKHVFPQILQDRPADTPIRIWVPGCATGEEAYSIAIALREHVNEQDDSVRVQIFATDISESALEKARGGQYLESIAADVGPERLNRHFTRIQGGYQISKSLRETCVFSRHNLIGDPPFSKLDLISCRNVLIYLEAVQGEIIPMFHYALNPRGFLILGRSEAGPSDELFSIVDSEHRIYSKKETGRRVYRYRTRTAASRSGAEARKEPARAPNAGLWDGVDMGKEVDRILLSKYGPSGVVVDEDLEVLEIRGPATPYLRLPAGKVSFHLLKLLPDTGLFLEVEKLAREAAESGEAVRRERVRHECDGRSGEVNIEVTPLYGKQKRASLVLFEPAVAVPEPVAESQEGLPGREGSADGRDRQIAKLKQDLAEARRRLHSVIEEYQTSNAESQNATEEALSTNEELQSLNEELETAKEELQSTNEELVTINQELESKNIALREAGNLTMSIVETVREPLLVLDSELRIRTANQSFLQTFQLSAREAEGQLLNSVSGGGWDVPAVRDLLGRVLPVNNSFDDFEFELDFPGIGHRVLMLSGCRLGHLDMILLAIDDVTARKEAEKTLRKGEEALRQAQKMEAIGRLAGGVAHDFNNLLTAIIGYTHLLADTLDSDHQAKEYLHEIETAGERAAALTDQLLAFSRRKVLQPKVFDMNVVVADFERMLRRVVGEEIKVVVRPAAGLWLVRADPGEIGRVVMNLCLNARDAMPTGGTLTILTANATLAEADAHLRHLAAGRYVELAVSDTGIGMGPEMQALVFEPFFTTKETGKGTGLGLATVLGIVEQSGGAIWCDSELGQGSRFRVLLPAVAGASDRVEHAARGLAEAPKGSAEVVLLVEDEEIVRKLARRVLEASGYVVVEARDGREGLSVCQTHQGRIDLLLSDVVMPELGGRELAESALVLRPDMKVLFMSGHIPDVVLQEGVQSGMPFLQKPFTPTDLALKVREVLDSPSPS
ncbi:MAG TPA: chemotaxis protein CheB [Bryobacteraceae bacterium]|nr:chemotaxis protein CheB [Bryobacteraceae bacterium]